MSSVRDKILDFIKNYISYGITIIVCLVYLFIDLLEFGFEDNPTLAITKTIIYIAISLTITSLLRMQGIVHGKADPIYKDSMLDYEKAIAENQCEGDRLDNWCEEKNEMRRIAEVKKRLKYAHLVYEKWEAGEYELPKKELKQKFTKRQIKALDWCNELEIELWSASYLTNELVKEGKKQKRKNISISGYMEKTGSRNALTSIATSVAFGFLVISLATDVSWANVIYSSVKVVTWLISGITALLFSFLFITTTYVDELKSKTTALKEFNEWCKINPRPTPVKKEDVKIEEQNTTNQTLVENQ